MFRIDDPSAATQLPAPSAAGIGGYFSEGDAVAGDPATVVTADFLNGVQEEFVAVIVAAGLALAKADNTQLLQALRVLFGITGNLAENGHIAIPVGNVKLIINWGGAQNADNSGLTHVLFDEPFSNRMFRAIAVNLGVGVPAAFHGIGNSDKGGMDVWSAQSSGVAAGAGTAFNYIAIGI